MVAVAWAVVVSVVGIAHAAVLYEEGFETDTGDWTGYNSELTRVASGGGHHLELTDPDPLPDGYYSGAYSVLGGYRTNLGIGWSSSVDVYIDLADSNIAAGTYGFQVSQAMTNTIGSHETDNIFEVETADPSNTGTNSVFVNVQNPYGPDVASGEFTQSGWYTFAWDFAPSSSAAHPGAIDIMFSIFDAGSNEFWSRDFTCEDVQLADVAGNRYMWFITANAERLGVDNVRLTSAEVIPEPSTFLIWALGLVGLALYDRRRQR